MSNADIDGLRGRNVPGPTNFMIGDVNSVVIGRVNCMVWMPLASGFPTGIVENLVPPDVEIGA